MIAYLNTITVLTKDQLKEIWDNNPIKFYIKFMGGLLDAIGGGIWNKIFAMTYFAVYPVTIVPVFTLVFCVPVFLLSILGLIPIPFKAISLRKEYQPKQLIFCIICGKEGASCQK